MMDFDYKVGEALRALANIVKNHELSNQTSVVHTKFIVEAERVLDTWKDSDFAPYEALRVLADIVKNHERSVVHTKLIVEAKRVLDTWKDSEFSPYVS